MEIFEISGFKTGVARDGVNYLEPRDAFQNIRNGLIYRQELKSRKGFALFAPRLSNETRVMGIFEDVLPNGTKELLVIDKNYLYKYVPGISTFVQIPFNARLGALYTFNIANDEDYVSGTSYFTKAGARRFVFTGKGMSSIYFYDGATVGEFTNVNANPALQDNPDYVQPPQGVLTRATNVSWFGERLNFFAPFIGGLPYYQGVLYSGIRDSSGNGDKFNIPGSGLLSADTYEEMNGMNNLGNKIIMNMQRSSWLLEKTKDAFNPYTIKKIPSVLGTDAAFSGVAWADEVKSAGKTGMLTCEGRRSLRFDDKIPYFTADEIDQKTFQYIYGGFERATSQFMFTYRGNTSNLIDVTQDKVLVYNYEESTWSVNDQRLTVFGQCDTGEDLVWNDIDYSLLHPSWSAMETTEEVWDKIGIGLHEQKTLAGDNDGFIYELNRDFDDYYVPITNITQAGHAVVTINPSAFKIGDHVFFTDVEGMTEINGLDATVLAATATSITVYIMSSGFTPYTGGGYVSKSIDFSAELIPFNPYRSQGRKCFISHIEFLVDRFSGDITAEIYDNQSTTPIKTTILSPDPYSVFPKQWLEMIVDHEGDFITLTLRRDSVNTQTIISCIRIHCSPGAD